MSRVSAQLHGRSPVPSFSGSRPYPGMYGRVAFGVAIEPPRSAYAPSMAPTIRLGKILGIEVGLNWSLIFVYALIVWTLATDVLPADVPNQGALTYWAIGALGGAAFYACLLAHELAHALVAKRYGVKVSGISLWLFGGVSRLDGDPPSAGAVMKAALRSVPVSAAMSSPVVTVPDWLTIGQFLDSVAPSHRFTTYPLHDPSGALTGVVRLGDLVKLGREAADGRLASVARPISEVPTTRPDEALSSLIERIGAAIENRVLVYDQGKLVGIVSPVDVARLITVRQASRS